jgi:hypothetical protein
VLRLQSGLRRRSARHAGPLCAHRDEFDLPRRAGGHIRAERRLRHRPVRWSVRPQHHDDHGRRRDDDVHCVGVDHYVEHDDDSRADHDDHDPSPDLRQRASPYFALWGDRMPRSVCPGSGQPLHIPALRHHAVCGSCLHWTAPSPHQLHIGWAMFGGDGVRSPGGKLWRVPGLAQFQLWHHMPRVTAPSGEVSGTVSV